jgi:large subunit ribosomal protein L31
MKKNIHPDYHKVIFVDTSTGKEFPTRSTLKSERTREVEGEQVPEIRVEISSASHPFFTGTMREIDTAGKIDRFRRRYQKKEKEKGS